jgi:hypothetical protein
MTVALAVELILWHMETDVLRDYRRHREYRAYRYWEIDSGHRAAAEALWAWSLAKIERNGHYPPQKWRGASS